MGFVSFEDKQIKATNCNQRKETLSSLCIPDSAANSLS